MKPEMQTINSAMLVALIGLVIYIAFTLFGVFSPCLVRRFSDYIRARREEQDIPPAEELERLAKLNPTPQRWFDEDFDGF